MAPVTQTPPVRGKQGKEAGEREDGEDKTEMRRRAEEECKHRWGGAVANGTLDRAAWHRRLPHAACWGPARVSARALRERAAL
mmetsp:Transcript_74208/g.210096  ORF Transcript_74208/g.210096 Transcript_74208/m.210096 type:complete len:83 (-) Transcript_74208:79-327(-)